MRFISISFFALLSLNSLAKLPELQTKQALSNIRFISNEGKYTYYQQRSGDLQMSTNYNNQMVLKQEAGTHFLLSSTPERKKILIEVIKDFHRNLDFFALNDIYMIDFGGTKAQKIAEGKMPRLHNKDHWLTFYVPRSKTIYVKNLLSNSGPVAIKLQNKVNPYFLPIILMPSPDTIFYTDINSEGYMGLQMYTLSDKKFSTVYKSKFSGMRLDICQNKEDLYIGEFSYDGINRGSSILKIPIFNNPKFKNFSSIYQSQLPDIGHLRCKDDSLFFIKTLEYNELINTRKSEAVEIDLKTNKLVQLTELEHVTQIVDMDGIIIIPFREKYFVAKGKSILNQDALKAKQ